MKHEFAHVDGLSNLFNSREDMMNSVFKSSVADSLDENTTIYVRCIPEDAAIFGKQFVGGSMWIVSHGFVLGDSGTHSPLRGYTKPSSSGEILPTDSIQEAIGKLDNRSVSNENDWLIIP